MFEDMAKVSLFRAYAEQMKSDEATFQCLLEPNLLTEGSIECPTVQILHQECDGESPKFNFFQQSFEEPIPQPRVDVTPEANKPKMPRSPGFSRLQAVYQSKLKVKDYTQVLSEKRAKLFSPQGRTATTDKQVTSPRETRSAVKKLEPTSPSIKPYSRTNENPRQRPSPTRGIYEILSPQILSPRGAPKAELPRKFEVSIADKVSQVLLSDDLKHSLAASNTYERYCDLLKVYQRSICLLSRDAIETFTHGLTTFNEPIAMALAKLTTLVDRSLSSLSASDDMEVREVLADNCKVYRTLLKTRFVLEHCLITLADILVIQDALTGD